MTETFSIERRKLMRAYGGKVILTPAAERGTGMVQARLPRNWPPKHGWFLARQFENPKRIRPGTAARRAAGDPARLRRPAGSTISSAAGAPAAR
jgi:hypothetical protein